VVLAAGWAGGCVQEAPTPPETDVVEQAVGDHVPTTSQSQDLSESVDSSCIEPDPLLLDGARQRFELSLSSSAVSFGAADPVGLVVTNQTSRGARCELSARFATEHQDGQTGALGTLDINSGAVGTLWLSGTALALPSTTLHVSGKIIFEVRCVDTDGMDLGAINQRLSFHPDGDIWWLYDDSARHDRFEDGALTPQAQQKVATLQRAVARTVEHSDGTLLQVELSELVFGRVVLAEEVAP